MSKLELTLQLVSPTFLNGADPKVPELRAASVRGQLRYWLRALLGARTQDLQKIWDQESAIFGSTGEGAKVTVRVFTDNVLATDQFPLLPHREGSGQNVSKAKALKPEQKFTLELATRPGVAMPDDAKRALQLWLLLGGVGKRSRRMMGAVQAVAGEQELLMPRSLEAWIEQIRAVLNGDGGKSAQRHSGSTPSFPALHPQHSWIMVGKEGFESAKEANQDLFRNLLRTPKFRSDSFGYAKGSARRASPLIAQVRKLGKDYYPVLTAMRSLPDRDIDWRLMSTFIKDAESHYEGVRVWGGW